jgi:hypothetical protein
MAVSMVVCMPCPRVVLLIQHVKRMRHIVTSFVATLAQPYFLTSSHKRRDFQKKQFIEYKMCFHFL